MKQYVRHKSGQGPIYEVGLDKGSQYVAKEVGDVTYEYYSLPAKEYDPFDPPEEWEDVTEDVQAYPWCWDRNHVNHKDDGTFYLSDCGDLVKKETHRVRKIDHLHNGPAFIVERKKA